MRFYDRLYGEIILNNEEAKLFDFKEFSRLKYLSQSNNSFFANISNSPTRLEHSLGVFCLASKLAEKGEFRPHAKELKFAALLHDFGHPPFSHISEHILIEMKNKDHEEYALELMEKSGIDRYLESINVDYKYVGDLITGKAEPLGALFNGSIDLDNLDNINRWNSVVGVPNTGYNPLKIVDGFVLSNGTLSLKGEVALEVEKWLKSRKHLYEFIENNELIINGNMLRKALNYAFLEKAIDDSYLLLSDFEAKELIKNSNDKSRKIIERMEKMECYERVIDRITDHNVSLDWKEKFDLEKDIAREFSFDEDKIVTFAGKLKGSRKIDLPFLGQETVELKNEKADEWRFIIALQKDIKLDKSKLEQFLEKDLKKYIKIETNV